MSSLHFHGWGVIWYSLAQTIVRMILGEWHDIRELCDHTLQVLFNAFHMAIVRQDCAVGLYITVRRPVTSHRPSSASTAWVRPVNRMAADIRTFPVGIWLYMASWYLTLHGQLIFDSTWPVGSSSSVVTTYPACELHWCSKSSHLYADQQDMEIAECTLVGGSRSTIRLPLMLDNRFTSNR